MKLEILHNNNHWIAINKPAGVSAHNDEDLSVIERLKEHTDKKPYLVHRLDKETSGLLLVAFDAKTCANLQEALKTSSKSYKAIVKGTFKEQSGKWQQKISSKSEGRKNPQGKSSDRKEALSEYKVLSQTKFLSLIEVQIKTGRQHQIRKHCVLNKHPIVGDSRYGEKKYNDMISNRYGFSGMALHSKSLSFSYEGKEFELKAPNPKNWAEAFSELIEN